MHIIFLDKCYYTLNRLQNSVNIAFICTGKQSCDLLYCSIYSRGREPSLQYLCVIFIYIFLLFISSVL